MSVQTPPTAARPTAPATQPPPRRRRRRVLTRTDRLVLTLMIGIPTLVHVVLVWVPTVISVLLSFARWDGIGGFSTAKFIGLQNYRDIFTIYPPFWPALRHNLIWLAFFLVVPTTMGLLLAYLLDKNLKGSRIYQSAIFVPVVLALAIVGVIWEFLYAPDPGKGLINSVLAESWTGPLHRATPIDWLGNPSINLWAVLIAASWRHVGYIMILYLAGLKSVDPTLREAAALDGANEWQTFRRVVFPSLAPVNVIVLVVTIIESLRAFDIVWVLNKGRNGLELLSTLVTDNIIGEASRIGYGSALAVVLLVISLSVILPYVFWVFRKDLRS